VAFGVRSFPTNTSFSTTRFHLLIFVFVMTLGLPFTVLQCLVSFIFSIPNLDPVSLPWSSTRECHHWTTGTETQTDLDSQSREALHHWLTSILCVVQSYTDSAKINFSTLVLALVCRTFSFRHKKRICPRKLNFPVHLVFCCFFCNSHHALPSHLFEHHQFFYGAKASSLRPNKL